MRKFDLSIIIPGLNEEFMQNTIDSVLETSGDRTEVICILDGYWPSPGIKDHERLTVIHNQTPIGQRQATNQGVMLSDAKFIMKLDAHCKTSPGFDEELMKSCEYDWTMIPRMYTLDAFHWVCPDCGKHYDQGPLKTKCDVCGKENVERKIIWDKKERKRTDYMWINDELRMKYFDKPGLSPYGDYVELKRRCSHKNTAWSKGDITDVMTCIGAGWFMHRERYWDLGGMDEGHGSWGQMAVELSMKAWLSGGRMVVNKKCWFAHLARTQKGFGFPYKHKQGSVNKARSHSREMWLGGKWPGAIHSYDWLIKKFSPLPGWTKEQEGEWKGVGRPMIHDGNKSYKKQDREDKQKHIIKQKEYNKGLTKGIVYYTDNQCEERILHICREQIQRSCNGYDIVSVSQLPIAFGRNIVTKEKRSVLTMFKQILMGLEASTADVIFLCEHDVLYHPSHFEFVPNRDDVFYYNRNIWTVEAKTGQAIKYDTQKTSQLCASRELLLKHYRERVRRVEAEGWERRMGYEPGHHKPPRGFDNYGHDVFISDEPNLDIKHGANLTSFRYKLDQFRRKPKNFQVADEVPCWGKTKKNFDRLLRNVSNCKIKIEGAHFNKL